MELSVSVEDVESGLGIPTLLTIITRARRFLDSLTEGRAGGVQSIKGLLPSVNQGELVNRLIKRTKQ